MFDWLKKKKAPEVPMAPEVLGLRLGGAFELDDLKFRLIEPELTIEGASRTHMIQAVGEVKLDENTRIVRYYTDDDAFLQVLQHGVNDEDISEVKLFYFFDTNAIDTSAQWDDWINNNIVQPQFELDGETFTKVWDNVVPVAMTENTWSREGKVTRTDQFIMLYERQCSEDLYESMLVAAEEKISGTHVDRCVVFSTGIDLTPTDFKLLG
ncbi:YjfK family protein [Thaumasiovibrio subtropicus]|uniref:YjfK family protein n=1 Tax=Thaumasiovibrio subtropicus TaxID=1891207 RepID=UPI000B34CB22|nr:YjfK family protein [Thaumasiovibrio subtropicus]